MSPESHQLWERGDARQKAFEVSLAHVTRAERHQDTLLKALLAHVSHVRSFLHTHTHTHTHTCALHYSRVPPSLPLPCLVPLQHPGVEPEGLGAALGLCEQTVSSCGQWQPLHSCSRPSDP